MGALSFANMSAVPITYALTGLVTEVSNARIPFLIGGSLMLLVAVVAFATPEVRRLAIDHRDPSAPGSDQNLSAAADKIPATEDRRQLGRHPRRRLSPERR